MDKLLVYYNPNHDSFYSRWTGWPQYKLNAITQYGHLVIQIFKEDYETKELILEVNVKKRKEERRLKSMIPEKECFRNKLINGATHLLNKLKK